MNNWVQSFLDNDSFFGRFMTKFGIIIGANIMFVLLSLPVVTIGAGLTALYHVMFRTLRNGGVVNPFKEFWAGFRGNFKQGTVAWIIFVAITGFLTVDMQICDQAGGMMAKFKTAIYVVMAIVIALYLYLLPNTAAFHGSILQLIRNAWYFIVKKPLKFIVIAFFDIFPLVLTYSDQKYQPLYAFIWVLCGFGLQAMLGATLLLPEFKPFLADTSSTGNSTMDPGDDEYSALDDLRELDGY